MSNQVIKGYSKMYVKNEKIKGILYSAPGVLKKETDNCTEVLKAMEYSKRQLERVKKILENPDKFLNFFSSGLRKDIRFICENQQIFESKKLTEIENNPKYKEYCNLKLGFSIDAFLGVFEDFVVMNGVACGIWRGEIKDKLEYSKYCSDQEKEMLEQTLKNLEEIVKIIESEMKPYIDKNTIATEINKFFKDSIKLYKNIDVDFNSNREDIQKNFKSVVDNKEISVEDKKNCD